MKACLITTMAFGVVLMLPLSLHAQESDPAAVVKAAEAATNAHNLDAAMAHFTDDAVVKIIPAPPGTSGVYTGAQEIRAWLQDLFAQNFTLEVTILQVAGDTVMTRTKTYADPTRQLGIAPLEGTEQYTIQNGKIKELTFTFTNESLAKLQAALAPQSMPRTGGDTSPINMLLVALGSLAILSGLGVALLRRRLGQQR
jgi:LPXTG-motif cell wall-anchored protein